MVDVNLNIKSLKHRLSSDCILDGIDLSLKGSQAVTVLGPNGAGKSTLLKALAAQFYCQSGDIVLGTLHSEKHRREYLNKCGYMPEVPIVFSELTVLEQLSLMANHKNISDEDVITEVIQMCKLQAVLKKRTSHLSLGYKQRLNLAQAIINKPLLLIMDEPLNGLDPHLIHEFRGIIKHLKKESLVLVSTHYLAEAQAVSDRVVIMQAGKILDNINIKNKPQDFDLEKLYMQHTAGALAI